MQASDIAHTMQHWHIYRKWNERLFLESFVAHEAGRADASPIEYWYQQELECFDSHVISLAEKLQSCGVFAGSSDEYLSYARRNRDQWEIFGHQLVFAMADKARAKKCAC